MPENESHTVPLPKSLEGHLVPHDRLDLIGLHVAVLGATALQVSDMLPLGADAADFVRTLEAEKEDK